MDNRLFNVNGGGIDLLEKTLVLAFEQSGFRYASGWQESEKKGLILCWHLNEHITRFPSKLGAKECMPMVVEWLRGDFAKTVKLGDWCTNDDHDGHNSLGWQVYVESWGHIGDQHYAICAIKPCYMWHGK